MYAIYTYVFNGKGFQEIVLMDSTYLLKKLSKMQTADSLKSKLWVATSNISLDDTCSKA
jgi:hypothetical protein